jgi:serine/threonine protein kinase
MQALADHGIVHRDLKPAQILVFGGGGGWRTMHAKVADFGRARGTDVTATATAAGGGFVGSYPWGAPESLESDVYTTMSDVYSFGCILSEVGARWAIRAWLGSVASLDGKVEK